MTPGAAMSPGKHLFTVTEHPWGARGYSEGAVSSFTATVDGGKRYSVVPIDGSPAVVADRKKPNQ